MQISTSVVSLPVATPQQQKAVHDEAVRRDNNSFAQHAMAKQGGQKVDSGEILRKISEMTDGGRHSVRFEMDSEVNILVVKVFDSNTNELVTQIPAESLLGTTKSLQEFRRGMMVDDQR